MGSEVAALKEMRCQCELGISLGELQVVGQLVGRHWPGTGLTHTSVNTLAALNAKT